MQLWPADTRSRSPDRRRRQQPFEAVELALLAEGADKVMQAVALVQRAERLRGRADLLEDDGDRAVFAVKIRDGERNSLALCADTQDDELTRLGLCGATCGAWMTISLVFTFSVCFFSKSDTLLKNLLRLSHRTILLYCMLCAQRKGKCNIFSRKTNLPVGAPVDMPHGGSLILSFPSAEGRPLRRYSGAPLEARFTLKVSGTVAAFGGRGCRRREMPVPTGGAKGKGTIWFPLPPLDSPQTPLRRDLWSRGETGVTGLGSVRFSAYMWLSCPEFFFASTAAHDSARPDGAGRQRSAAKSSASIKRCTLSTRRPCGPSHLDARPKGVAS